MEGEWVTPAVSEKGGRLPVSAGQRRWLFPMLLAAVGLLGVLALCGLPPDDGITVTPTPTKTPVSEVAAATRLPEVVTVEPVRTSTPAGSVDQLSPALPTSTLPARDAIVSPTQIPTFTPSPIPLPSWTASPIPSPTPTLAPTWTATPIATFTPPPHAGRSASEQDHYWLDRPIPPEYTNWTDRIYPYGSNRGGTLPTHHGVEFYNPVGVPVLAAGAGMVVTAGSDGEVMFGPQADFYGQLVVIRHEELYQGQYLYTLYGHLSDVLVSEGARVAAGDLIGLVGGTGVANGGAHLHFEVRVGENSYEATRNPELWLRPFPGRGTIAGRLLWPDGSYVYEASLLIRRADDPTLFVNRSVSTYADDSVNPDDIWRENLTTPDLEAGPYEIIFRHPELNFVIRELVWVYPGETSLVTLTLPQ
jgi:murein DD-endopeptidase MepM/ murein hydrolase activator NlpD